MTDPDTGLYDAGARYYNPETFVFTQADSVIPDVYNPQALNRYAYCLNNPVKYEDPDGHEPITLTTIAGFVAVCAVVGGVIAGVANAYEQYHETGVIDCKAVAKESIKGAVVGGGTGLVLVGGAAVYVVAVSAGATATTAAGASVVTSSGLSVVSGSTSRFTNASIEGDFSKGVYDAFNVDYMAKDGTYGLLSPADGVVTNGEFFVSSQISEPVNVSSALNAEADYIKQNVWMPAHNAFENASSGLKSVVNPQVLKAKNYIESIKKNKKS